MCRYRLETELPISGNPLQWQCEKEEECPLLSALVRKCLTVHGTFDASEGVFSTAGDKVNLLRTALLPQHVDVLIYLKRT